MDNVYYSIKLHPSYMFMWEYETSIVIIDGPSQRRMMPDLKVLPKISAYVAENKLKMALEVVP